MSSGNMKRPPTYWRTLGNNFTVFSYVKKFKGLSKIIDNYKTKLAHETTGSPDSSPAMIYAPRVTRCAKFPRLRGPVQSSVITQTQGLEYSRVEYCSKSQGKSFSINLPVVRENGLKNPESVRFPYQSRSSTPKMEEKRDGRGAPYR